MKTTLTAKKFLDNIHGLILVLSEKGIVEYVNRYAAELLGYDRNDIIGKNWFDNFIPAENKRKSKTTFKKILKGKLSQVKSKDEYVKTNSGDLHLIEWHDTYLKDKDENIIGTFSSGEDVTEKHLLKLYLADQQVKHRQERLAAILEATEKERKFLAYELHDGINQVLTTCKLLLESEISAGNGSAFVQRTFNLIQEVIQNLRELSHELNPADLGNEGLYEAARKLVERINATGKMKVTANVKGLGYLKMLCPHISLSLYRIMQEALTNIIKHAEAKKVMINLVSTSRAVDMEIRDDGKGFDRNDEKIGLGLKTIYTRAEAIGGRAHISSSPGEGTLLSVHVPIPYVPK
jgi:PAS domain S-box-containing protein